MRSEGLRILQAELQADMTALDTLHDKYDPISTRSEEKAICINQ